MTSRKGGGEVGMEEEKIVNISSFSRGGAKIKKKGNPI